MTAISKLEVITHEKNMDLLICFILENVESFFQDVSKPEHANGIESVEFLASSVDRSAVA